MKTETYVGLALPEKKKKKMENTISSNKTLYFTIYIECSVDDGDEGECEGEGEGEGEDEIRIRRRRRKGTHEEIFEGKKCRGPNKSNFVILSSSQSGPQHHHHSLLSSRLAFSYGKGTALAGSCIAFAEWKMIEG